MKMEFEDFLDAINGLELNGAMMLTRKIGESEKNYKARKQAFTLGLSEGLNKLDELVELISQAKEFYDKEFKRFEALNQFTPVIEFIYPSINKWDSVDEMNEDLNCYLRYYKRMPDFGTSNFYNTARELKPQYMVMYRKSFIEDSISDIPYNRHIIFIKSPFDTYYKDERVDSFYSTIESMQDIPSGKLARVYDVNKLEWFAFCVEFISPERIDYLSREWQGDPKYSKVIYIQYSKVI